ncbi:Fis family transcriptional regulator [Skermanella stibiiresistens SB22]|uniref:Fis family transcriptional regulator n=1 Tax=Skermanella stibiiresistens SB22 TaxID=1385369 RepID=W9GW28_9PROT|nr:sigma-54 dependent transcriptional regulator [Skermanella stibiiresistens]EWY38024.1 Fis family transcriptional regulator [Skermanella stibiiresistens SB22]
MSGTLSVLLVEDDDAVRASSIQTFQLAGIDAKGFGSAEPVRDMLHPDFPAVIVTDVRLPGMNGLALLEHATRADPKLPVVVITGHGDISMAVEAMRIGAYDFIEKPFPTERLVNSVQRALERRALTLEVGTLRRKLSDRDGIETVLLGQSPAIQEVRRVILQVADAAADVLILGETGTGKELVARCLHQFSPRRDNNFVALNCGAMPETMFESEVFGHETGAFTGASRQRVGRLEHADGGTLLLDEIESMPLALQVKLLRAVQERMVERLGSNKEIPIDVRIVAATKEDLAELSRQQRFRADLYYRLNVISVTLPPLRERREDIPLLFEHFVLQGAARFRREAPVLSSGQRQKLMAYAWPGNVRELRNVADRFVLGVHGSPLDLTKAGADAEPPSFAEQVDAFERATLAEAMSRHQGNIAAVSDSLKLPRKTLYDKLKRLNLAIETFR